MQRILWRLWLFTASRIHPLHSLQRDRCAQSAACRRTSRHLQAFPARKHLLSTKHSSRSYKHAMNMLWICYEYVFLLWMRMLVLARIPFQPNSTRKSPRKCQLYHWINWPWVLCFDLIPRLTILWLGLCWNHIREKRWLLAPGRFTENKWAWAMKKYADNKKWYSKILTIPIPMHHIAKIL